MKYYVPKKLLLWDSIKAGICGRRFPVTGFSSCGFIEVFDDLEKLKAEYPDVPYMTLDDGKEG